MNKYYVAYSDSVPSKPGGQDCKTTDSRCELYIFENRNKAGNFVSEIKEIKSHRLNPKIIGVWSEELDNIFIS